MDDATDSGERERRLGELRLDAAAGHVHEAAVAPSGPPAGGGYYGQPLLKPPVWTWEVPAYFFVGGAAGAAAAVGAVARALGADAALVRDARWIAAAGAMASPPLLISDLGRPGRFLNMLRVFKIQSPMSVGAWTLAAFSTAAGAAAFADLVDRRAGGRLPIRVLGNAADALSAATGLVLSTYTGVLIGATAIPVWSRHVRLLPLHFGASGLGTAVSLLELLGHRQPALNRLAIGAAAAETLMGWMIERDRSPDSGPLRGGPAGAIVRAGSLLAGPLPLALRLLAPRSRPARALAAVATVAGSVLTRTGWIEAGRASAGVMENGKR